MFENNLPPIKQPLERRVFLLNIADSNLCCVHSDAGSTLHNVKLHYSCKSDKTPVCVQQELLALIDFLFVTQPLLRSPLL